MWLYVDGWGSIQKEMQLINSIPIFEQEFESKSFGTKLIKLELNEKELNILSCCDAAKDILQIVGCIAAQAMVFNDLIMTNKLGQAAGQTLSNN